jgi:hypothetical protein
MSGHGRISNLLRLFREGEALVPVKMEDKGLAISVPVSQKQMIQPCRMKVEGAK